VTFVDLEVVGLFLVGNPLGIDTSILGNDASILMDVTLIDFVRETTFFADNPLGNVAPIWMGVPLRLAVRLALNEAALILILKSVRLVSWILIGAAAFATAWWDRSCWLVASAMDISILAVLVRGRMRSDG
jgi:hypothetical protein